MNDKVNITIIFPDINMNSINLYVLVPAWWFYSSQEDKEAYLEECINSGCGNNDL